jgi:hypothetical protein
VVAAAEQATQISEASVPVRGTLDGLVRQRLALPLENVAILCRIPSGPRVPTMRQSDLVSRESGLTSARIPNIYPFCEADFIIIITVKGEFSLLGWLISGLAPEPNTPPRFLSCIVLHPPSLQDR